MRYFLIFLCCYIILIILTFIIKKMVPEKSYKMFMETLKANILNKNFGFFIGGIFAFEIWHIIIFTLAKEMSLSKTQVNTLKYGPFFIILFVYIIILITALFIDLYFFIVTEDFNDEDSQNHESSYTITVNDKNSKIEINDTNIKVKISESEKGNKK